MAAQVLFYSLVVSASFALVISGTVNQKSKLSYDEIKSRGKLWTARIGEIDTSKHFLGALPPRKAPSHFPTATVDEAATQLESFDAREKWSNCKDSINTVRNQAKCGSCWAVASAAVLSDLTCIASNGRNIYLSDEDLLSCCPTCCTDSYCGCSGAFPEKAFDYWTTTGLVSGGPYNTTDGCLPYTVRPGQDSPLPPPQCTYECKQGGGNKEYFSDKHKGKQHGLASGEEQMKSAILNYGPIAVQSFEVYPDFSNYSHGVYNCPTDQKLRGYHSAKIIGWGEENGTPYWLAVNSWGEIWGNSGFYKMLRGYNECGFEGEAVWGVADEPSTTTTTSTSTSTTSTTTSAGTTNTTPHHGGATSFRAQPFFESCLMIFGLLVMKSFY